jgi:transposase-like protein
MASDLSKLDLLVIQIDGIHIVDDVVLLAAVDVDGAGAKHPLGVIKGTTENAVVVQALLDNLIERGLDPTVCRLFIVDGAKALRKAIRKTFGCHTPIQRCQVHKARNILERLPKPLHASVRTVLRQAWELDDADRAERLIRNLARRLEQQAPGVATSILEGLDEILTFIRLGLPAELRRSLACTNIIENMMGTVRRLPQCQTLAGCFHGAALDQCCHAGGRQRLSPAQSPQATLDIPHGSSRSPRQTYRPRCC